MNEPSTPASPERYRIALHGGGIEEVDRAGVRDRIRRGEVVERSELARAGTEEWKAAREFPELARYLQLAASQAAAREAPVSITRAYETMGQRLGRGLAYPLAHGGVLTILALTILSAVPVLGVLVTPIAAVYVLEIVRESANGDTRMPAWFDTSDLTEVLIRWLKTFFVTMVALMPMLVWFVTWMGSAGGTFDRAALVRLFAGLAVTGLVALFYYPACLATVAVWHSVLDSLNPVYVLRVIRTIGADYVLVVVVWVAVWMGTLAVGLFSDTLFGGIPILGSLPAAAISFWGQFYGAHILGYAIYRHTDELGWG